MRHSHHYSFRSGDTHTPNDPPQPNAPDITGYDEDRLLERLPHFAIAPESSPVLPPPPAIPANVETAGGSPLTWSDPAHITVAVASQNLPDQPVVFSNVLPPAFIPLVDAAEHAWEAVANVNFDNVGDLATSSAAGADIRVGLATLSPMGFIGLTDYAWDGTNHFRPGTEVTIDDPQDRPVTSLANGDFAYTGFQTMVFQDLLHEFGHTIGLAHNPADPNSIMNPVLSSANQYIDGQDATTLRTIYGAPSATAIALSQADPTLAGLLPAGSAITV